MSNSHGQRYRFGASFVDHASGVRFEGHHPLERPDLWKMYLDGAQGQYRAYGFEATLRRQELEAGDGVSLFIIGFAPDGQAVGGLRFYGPLEGSHEAAMMVEMAASPEIEQIGEMIDNEVPRGVLEVKGVWSTGEAMTGVRLGAALSRSVTYAMTWLGAELAVAASQLGLLPIGTPTGARMVGECWVPFPDDRYKTIAVEWRRARTYELSSPEHQRAFRQDTEQLARGNRRDGIGVVTADSTHAQSRRPIVLDVANRADREVLRVLREDPSLLIVDRFNEQREQLASVKPTPADSILTEGQRWVYFPWRRAVVRLLAPRGFSGLRLDRNRNKLTLAEQARQRTLRIGVVGASAGHSIAHILAMEGLAGEIRLADFDTLELSNLNRVPASVLDLGINKAVVAARRISEIDPYLAVVVQPEGISPENLGEFMDGLDIVIEECDSLDIKYLVREAARERRIPVIMETSDRGVLDVERFDLEPNRPIFHGLLGDMDYAKLHGLSAFEKGPYLLKMLGAQEVSARGAASVFELGQTITAWPQLASEVTLGAVTAAEAIRRIGQAGDLPSGRVRFDVEKIIDGLTPVEVDTEAEEEFLSPPPLDPPLVSDDPIDLIVDSARRAPSGGNVQPWRFEADDDEIRFYVVPERTSIMDVQGRGSYVALGASLFNARVTAASMNSLGPVHLFPQGRASHHVATLELGSMGDTEIASLQEVVHTRSTNRRMGSPAPIADTTLQALRRAVQREGANVRIVTEREGIDACAAVLAESDRLRFLMPNVHRQMFDELRWPGRDSLEEGLDVRTLEMDSGGYGILELLGRTEILEQLSDWRVGGALGARTRFVVGSSSALALITIDRPDPASYLRAGGAVERFWLTAESHGLAVQPVAPVFMYAIGEEDLLTFGGDRHVDELHRLSQQFNGVWDVSDTEYMAMLFRVSHAPPPSVRSIRLPLQEVLSRDTAEPWHQHDAMAQGL
jgi:hypothetical protein